MKNNRKQNAEKYFSFRRMIARENQMPESIEHKGKSKNFHQSIRACVCASLVSPISASMISFFFFSFFVWYSV